jgi:predicted transcriptional regulator
MSQESASAPITIRALKETVSEIDALAAAMDRSRNYVINQAIQLYLEANAWQVERIKAGIEDAREGRVHPAEDVFAAIAEKHGWKL